MHRYRKKSPIRKVRIDKIKSACFDVLCGLANETLGNLDLLFKPRLLSQAAFGSTFFREKEAEYERAAAIAAHRRYLYALKKAKLIREEKTARGLMYALTNRGAEALLRHRIIKKGERMKNKLCVVIFDIPEDQRRIRSDFRFFLKQANFFQLQKSVWATDKNIVDDLKQLVRLSGADRWINILLAEPIIISRSVPKK